MDNLNKYGVVELSSDELKTTEGGSLLMIAAGLALGALAGLIVALFIKSDGECDCNCEETSDSE